MKARFVRSAALATLVVATLTSSISAKPIRGRLWDSRKIDPRHTLTYRVACAASQSTTIELTGDRSTDLDLYVYDPNGNLVAADEDVTDICATTFRAYRTSEFVVKIVNRGNDANSFTLRME